MKNRNIDFTELVSTKDIENADFEEKEYVLELFDEAKSFIENQNWCNNIRKSWWGESWEDMIGVFLFEIDSNLKKPHNYYWVVVGDLPPAFIYADNIGNEMKAIQRYVDLMQEWIDAVYSGKDTSNLINVNVSPTKEWADELAGRIDVICEDILKIPPPYNF